MITNEQCTALCREAELADEAYHAALSTDQSGAPSRCANTLKEAWHAAKKRRDEATMTYATQIESIATLGGWAD